LPRKTTDGHATLQRSFRMKTTKALLAAMAISAMTFSVMAEPPAKAKDAGSTAAKEHSRAKSGEAKIGEKAPEFTLTDVNGKTFTLADATKAGKIVVLEWFNPECPAVKMHHEKNPTFKNLAAEFAGKDVVMVAINSGGEGKQGADKDENIQAAKDYGMAYPILMDSTGEIGKKYGAKTTPHMFVIDKNGVLAYAGAIDNAKGTKVGDINYVSQAVNELLAGQTVTTAETKAYGCAVKYAN
jgi:peroxiredoxin